MFRIKRDGHHANYTCISNVPVRDTRLTPEQLGFLLKILSLPDDWEFSTKGMAKICGMSERKACTLLNSLEELGYLRRERSKDEQGRFCEFCYYFFEHPLAQNPHMDEPSADEPCSDEPCADEPCAAKSRQLNTNTLNTKEENTILTKAAEEKISVEKQIGADALKTEYNSSVIDEAVDIIRSAMNAKQRTYSGVTVEESELKRVFGAATQQDVRRALDKAGSGSRRNFAAYFGAVLFGQVSDRLKAKQLGESRSPNRTSSFDVDDVMRDILAKYRGGG